MFMFDANTNEKGLAPTCVGAAEGCDLLMLMFANQDQKIAAFGSSYRV
jgi:hypothetical protein